MNVRINFDITDPNMLEVINEKLVTYKSIISLQKEEILKTEEIIKQYTDHLDIQNEALKLYLEEEEKLNNKEKKIIRDNDFQHNSKNSIEDVQILSEENINEVNIIETPKEINFDDEVQLIQNSNKSNQTLENIEKHYPNNISTINITGINNETVYSMSIFHYDIFIGGSNGMLMKHSAKDTFKYETNTKDDILQLEITRNHAVLSLFAFTKTTVIIYKNIEEPHIYRHINLPGIEHVFRKDNALLYIPVKDGIVHQLNTVNGIIKQLKLPYGGCVSSMATSNTRKDFSLAVFTNGLLYQFKIIEDLLNCVQRIKEAQGLKRVLKIVNLGYLYYSDTTIWIVDNKMNKLNNERFENGIKFVKVCDNNLVVVDNDDTLHIYKEKGIFLNKCYSQRIIGDITAISIFKQKAYLSVGKEIIIVDIK